MKAAGYVPTENLMTDPDKPTSNVIDFCFVDPTEYTTLDYRYIDSFGDLDWYNDVTDHPMIYTEIAPVEVAEQLPLPEFIAPEPEPEPEPDPEPEDVVIEGNFNSPDDVFTY